MVWQKTDDQFGVSKKVVRIPRARRFQVIGLWTLAGNYACRVLSDGVLEAHELDELGARKADIAELVRVGLWHENAHDCAKCVAVQVGTIVIHDFLVYNPSRAEVEAAKEAERLRKAAYRASKKASPVGRPTGTDTGTPAGRDPESELPVPGPSPARPPSSSKKEESAAKRGSRVPSDFPITDSMRLWATQNVPLVNIDVKTPEFVDYWKGVAGEKGVKLDWEATWHNGMRKQQEWAKRDAPVDAPAPRRVVSGRAQ